MRPAPRPRLERGVSVAGLDLVFPVDAHGDASLVERLARAGAHVWLTKEVSERRVAPCPCFRQRGVPGRDGQRRAVRVERVFAVRRAATELRGGATGAARGPGADVLVPGCCWPPAKWRHTSTRCGCRGPRHWTRPPSRRRYAGLGLWFDRGAEDPIAAGAGLGGEMAVVEAFDRTPAPGCRAGGAAAVDATGVDTSPGGARRL